MAENLLKMAKNGHLYDARLPVYFYAPKLHPDAPTFEINGHEASVIYQYDELHIV